MGVKGIRERRMSEILHRERQAGAVISDSHTNCQNLDYAWVLVPVRKSCKRKQWVGGESMIGSLSIPIVKRRTREHLKLGPLTNENTVHSGWRNK